MTEPGSDSMLPADAQSAMAKPLLAYERKLEAEDERVRAQPVTDDPGDDFDVPPPATDDADGFDPLPPESAN